MLGVRGSPASIQDTLQSAYRGIVMAEAFGQFQLYPSQRPIGLLPADPNLGWTKVDADGPPMPWGILCLFPLSRWREIRNFRNFQGLE
jgi:hypothetical protein